MIEINEVSKAKPLFFEEKQGFARLPTVLAALMIVSIFASNN
jgi:hypothetical protein